MFVDAIETVAAFTRPIHTISRTYGSQRVVAGAATTFLVNDEGWALTCKHVADLLATADRVNSRYAQFRQELAAPSGHKRGKTLRKELSRKYGYSSKQTVEIKNNFVNCADFKSFELRAHPSLDLALIRFKDFKTLFCKDFPRFALNGDELKQGKYICRLGFPFPEFNNFQYNQADDTIEWTKEGRQGTPRFPIEGMVTRHLNSPNGVIGLELSTPGLRGQSGGPAFDSDSVVWGMQAATNHLDLNFDVDQKVLRQGKQVRVSDHAFLHVGHYIHVNELKGFMADQGVKFATA